MENNPTTFKESTTKKCPLCAEKIQGRGTLVPFMPDATRIIEEQNHERDN